MSVKPRQSGSARRGLWRRLTSIVAIYALVLQSLIFGFAAAPAAALASVDGGSPAFELCVHGTDGAPVSPADLPGHHGNTHCIFCFAGGNQYLAQGPLPLSPSWQIDLQAGNALWPADHRRVSILARYSIARPRGPPLSA
jgi:hypothetical protein